MKLLTVTLPRDHNLFHYGDVHDGSSLSTQKGWAKFVRTLTSEYDGCSNNYAIDGGDPIEAITVDDKRFSEMQMTEPLPLRQMRFATEKREPIASQLLTMLDSNHTRKLWRFGPIAEMMCEDLGIPFGTYTCKISIMDKKGRLMYKVYETHGSKSITSNADDPLRQRVNMQLILKRHLRRKAADCAVMIKHHVHKLIVTPPVTELFLTDNGKRIQQNYTSGGQSEAYIHPDARWYGCAGSFMRLYEDGMSGYAEIAEYDPVEIGFLVTKVRKGKIVSVEPVYLDA